MTELPTSLPPDDAPRRLRPRTVDELTAQNVAAIQQLESAALSHGGRMDALADKVASFAGSALFLGLHVVWFAFWIVVNVSPGIGHFDPYPFTFLTLVVSLEAIFLSSFILISQNYEMRITERRSQLDLQINLLAEQENTKILQLLDRMAKKMGLYEENDPEIQVLEQATRPETLARQIEDAYRERAERTHSNGDKAHK